MKDKNYSYIKLLLVGVFCASRMINLDADIPFGWKLAMYQHIDEIFYSISAVNLFHYGTWDVEKFGFRFIDAEVYLALPLWNIFTYLFLEIFENPLYAVRIPAILAGTGVYILYLTLIFRLNSYFKKTFSSTVLLILFAIYPICDPIFILSNTINEPTIYRLFFACLLFFVFVGSEEITKKKAFLIGVLATFSVLFVYFYNLFLILFAFLVILQKPNRTKILSFLIGCSVVLICYLTAFDLLSNVSLADTITEVGGSNIKGVKHFNPIDIFMNIFGIFSTNFLTFSPAVMIFFIFGALGLPMIIYKNRLIPDERTKSILEKIIILSWLFIISYTLQTVFISDFVPRKGLIIYFPVLITSYIFLETIASFSLSGMKRRPLFLMVMLAVGLLLMKYTSTVSKMLDYAGYFNIYKWIEVTRMSYWAVSVVFIFAVLSIFVIPKMNIIKWIAPLILTITIVFNMHLIVIHKYLHSHYTFCETISGIGNLPPGYFVGNLSYTFTIGNKQHKPFLFMYTCKFKKTPDCGHTASRINTRVFNLFIRNVKVPVYTVVQGGIDLKRLMEQYPNARIVYSMLKYRDVATYLDYRKLDAVEENDIHVVMLNKSTFEGAERL